MAAYSTCALFLIPAISTSSTNRILDRYLHSITSHLVLQICPLVSDNKHRTRPARGDLLTLVVLPALRLLAFRLGDSPMSIDFY
jgi:hypothetical protein